MPTHRPQNSGYHWPPSRIWDQLAPGFQKCPQCSMATRLLTDDEIAALLDRAAEACRWMRSVDVLCDLAETCELLIWTRQAGTCRCGATS